MRIKTKTLIVGLIIGIFALSIIPLRADAGLWQDFIGFFKNLFVPPKEEEMPLGGAVMWYLSGGRLRPAVSSWGMYLPASEALIISTTTPQFRIGYDGNNIASLSVGSGGILTVSASGGAVNFLDHIGIKNQNELRFYDNGNYVGFEAPSLSADQIWALATSDGTSGQVLTTDGSGNLYFSSAASGITTPASSTDDAIVRWDGTGGDTIQNSLITIDDSGNLTTTGNITGDVLTAGSTDSGFTFDAASGELGFADYAGDGDSMYLYASSDTPLILYGAVTKEELHLNVSGLTAARTAQFPNLSGTFLYATGDQVINTSGTLTVSGTTTLATIDAGIWQGTAIADAYIPDNITIDLSTLASTITVADESADTSCYVGYFTDATGSLAAKTGTNLTFNSNTGILTATGFAGNLTGAVTGNASTATALAANGGNCSSGQSPLGVDASGAVESCFDVWTEAENTAAGYISGNETITLSGDASGSGTTAITVSVTDLTISSEATGDVLYFTGSAWSRLGKGTAGQVLTTTSDAVYWSTPAGGGDITDVWDCSTGNCETLTASASDSLDAGSAISVELPNSATPTTDATGEIALDVTITDHQPLWQYYDGGENMTIIAIDTAQLPAEDNEIVKYDAASDKFVLEADAGSGTSEVSETFKPYEAKLPTAYYALIDAGDKNWRLLYDDATKEAAVWEFILDDDWGSGTLYSDIYFSMTSATGGAVVWNASIMAVTAGDSADVGTDSYDTTNASTETVPSTAGYLDKDTITLTNADSCAAGDYVRFKLERDGANGSDTAAGDVELMQIVIRE